MNMTNSWQTLSPLLKKRGYCVFALTYGKYRKVDPTGQFGGLDRIQNSSRQLKKFVSRVRRATGSRRVDLVGWSEGGWLARQYIQFDGGNKSVHSLVGLAPANGPTNVSQLVFGIVGLTPTLGRVWDVVLRAIYAATIPLVAQAADPKVFRRLNKGGGTSPEVHYTHIASEYDELVPPSSAFVPTGKHVRNIVLQRGCPIDTTDHLSISGAPRAMQFLLNALDPAHAVKPPCMVSPPVVG